ARHGRLLGIKEKIFLADLMDSVVEVSGGAYPVLVEKRDYIKKLITIEEEQFAKTMDNGMGILEEYVAKLDEAGKTMLDGADAFKLYDTYGFPVEMTEEILAERGITVDMDGFKENMDHQKELARQGQRSTADVAWKDAADYDKLPKSTFLGYTDLVAEAKVLYANSNEGKNILIFDRTPFYATGGGQIHDTGVINVAGNEYHVNDVTKENDIFLHFVDEFVDNVNAGEKAELKVDVTNRNRTARGHSATHILQQALKDVLGEHVSQAGSYVDNHYLRFDFNHFEAMTQEQIKQVEYIVNDKIDAFLPILMQEMRIEEAQKMGATAIFGEKYGEIVRVVSMGDYSIEFCGGTHIDNTGKIGAFKIISEAGIASGIRRIEAITGTQVINYTEGKEAVISNVCSTLKSNESDLEKKAAQLVTDNKELEKTIKSLKADEIASSLDDVIASGVDINGIKLIAKRFDNTDVAQLREMADAIKSKESKSIFVAAAVNEGKIAILVSVSDELVSEGFHAGKLVKEIAQVAGGNGGGKAGMAQAGAKDESKLDEALKLAEVLVANK
ncbi:alanine--tRNA ligase, partial [Mogibacterium pumilum]|uniref:alanine--tRNA ligase n=1 Tax=Mogibacterium pumilum TaxID=86332 RepID=UPI001F022067